MLRVAPKHRSQSASGMARTECRRLLLMSFIRRTETNCCYCCSEMVASNIDENPRALSMPTGAEDMLDDMPFTRLLSAQIRSSKPSLWVIWASRQGRREKHPAGAVGGCVEECVRCAAQHRRLPVVGHHVREGAARVNGKNYIGWVRLSSPGPESRVAGTGC